MTDVLAIGAHPDDLELSCGATITKLIQQGRSVVFADLTQGELSTRGTKDVRAKEALKAASILGVTDRRNLAIPDGNIERNQANLHKVITLLRDVQPKILIIPHSFDRHPDHIHAHQLCREAWFYAGLAKVPTEQSGKSQPPHRPDNWFEFMQWFEFVPSFIIDVADTWDKKMKAVLAYESQFHNPKSNEPETKLSQPQFLELVETRGRSYGEKIGKKYGEPFFCPSPLGLDTLFDLTLAKG
jgi:bacillithiol biosynthesis deacetylase BshB1